MEIDLDSYFQKYKEIADAADRAFLRIGNEHPDCLKCKIGCSDCCHAMFDLTLVEAIYINRQFNEKIKGTKRDRIIENANTADRKAYKIKKEAYRKLEAGKNEREIISEISEARVRCPLLDENETCNLYADRPITCRIYGLPTAINGEGYTCGMSGFEKGIQYQTVNMDIIYQKLHEISDSLVKGIESKHAEMVILLVPLSMALLTDYDEAYLGIGGKEENKNK